MVGGSCLPSYLKITLECCKSKVLQLITDVLNLNCLDKLSLNVMSLAPCICP
uniref:Uncharacterized protein n=1 Tax=Arundo donax TaxID=35708 RepID=A0A0A8ZLB3_ARUDO